MGIQNDPQYFPNPDQFDPDRFSAEEKAKRDKFLHLPFGEGPRICIGKLCEIRNFYRMIFRCFIIILLTDRNFDLKGNRFGLLQSKTGLVYMLSKYNVEVSETTPIPMKLEPKSFIPTPAGGMNLKITKRRI